MKGIRKFLKKEFVYTKDSFHDLPYKGTCPKCNNFSNKWRIYTKSEVSFTSGGTRGTTYKHMGECPKCDEFLRVRLLPMKDLRFLTWRDKDY